MKMVKKDALVQKKRLPTARSSDYNWGRYVQLSEVSEQPRDIFIIAQSGWGVNRCVGVSVGYIKNGAVAYLGRNDFSLSDGLFSSSIIISLDDGDADFWVKNLFM